MNPLDVFQIVFVPMIIVCLYYASIRRARLLKKDFSKKKEVLKKMTCNPQDLAIHEVNPFTKGQYTSSIVKAFSDLPAACAKGQVVKVMNDTGSEWLPDYKPKGSYTYTNDGWVLITHEGDSIFDMMAKYKPIAIKAEGRPIEVIKETNCRNCGAPHNDDGCDYCGTGKKKRGPYKKGDHFETGIVHQGLHVHNPISSFHLDIN